MTSRLSEEEASPEHPAHSSETLCRHPKRELTLIFYSSFIRIVLRRMLRIEAVFLPVLDYGDVVYGNAAPFILKPLGTVYHSALRFISGELYRTHHYTPI